MQMKIPVTMISLLVLTLNPVTGRAQDGPVPDEDQSPPLYSALELGIGYSTDDAYRFGRYTGLKDEGPYLLGDVDAWSYTEDGRFWRARGTNLGLDSRYLRLEGGRQGQQQYFIEYDRLPNYETNTARTPFLGVGSGSLTLPTGFDINTNLNSFLLPFDIETTRERIGLGARFVPRRNWKLDVALRHETRDGTDRIGSVIAKGIGGGPPDDGLLFNATAALLPEPIDYTTQLVDVTLHYGKGKGQFELAYHLSLFDNGIDALTWEDPFAAVNGMFDARQSLEPDNEFHQLVFTGNYQLPYKSQLTGLLSAGRMTQDQAFLPYSVGGGAAPRNSFDGEVWLTTAQLALNSRPMSRLRLNARYRYDERDNNSPVNSYAYIVADDPSVAFAPVTNRPLGYQRDQFDLTANYRIRTGMSLRAGYRYDAMARDYQNVERADTREKTLFAKWKLQPHAKLDLALNAESSSRDGSNYQPPVGENPALRKYYLADRGRTKLGASMHIMPTERLDITASTDYIRDEYHNSEIGLTEATQPTWTLDIAWQPRSNVTTSAWYTREVIESSQAGEDEGAGAILGIPNWTADFDDTVDTLGLGARITGIRSKWDVGADIVHTRTTGEVALVNLVPGGGVTPYPDLKTSLNSVKLWTQYRYRKDLSWKLGYRYERYSEDNWALDNLQADSVTNLLLLDEETPDYDVHIIAASVIYHF
jgi:MtrB/PioB family decaheme-associated outer membrane protein